MIVFQVKNRINIKTKAKMGLAEKAEQAVEQKIYDEGGSMALWKYKAARLFKRCGCM